ncbi:MAG TPA: helix-hairpin-helix domain-containing protein [bacterium]|nr:helix-hairpin-helix domain-containing protein [bacterium]HQG45488.1 helix-hairpin-helix domain-containing protein [bacterium]HQI48750.1 helix-hairpin-helix domain-containing protein [bacterium]HQJ65237.1 helix-hairpin-helix domain-containing protein [bacterium]
MTSKRTLQDSEDLQTIPGVGPNLARHLGEIGYHRVSQLRDADPEAMYARLCELHGGRIDRCVLYVFREAVYFASHDRHDPELLKWWNWKEGAEADARESGSSR